MTIPLDWDSIIFLSVACSAFLFIWLETNGLYEYLRYFNLGGRFIGSYNEYKKKDYATLLFIPYLLVNHNCFFTRLICCSICLSFWINLIINLCFFYVHNFPFTFTLSLLFYYILVLLKRQTEK
jgi:hypothetical protein